MVFWKYKDSYLRSDRRSHQCRSVANHKYLQFSIDLRIENRKYNLRFATGFLTLRGNLLRVIQRFVSVIRKRK
jgi:hypothetical protein